MPDNHKFRITPIDVALFALLMLSAAWFRFHNLGEYSLWLDEGFTWLDVHLPWEQSLEALRIDGVHPPLYFFLVKLITLVAGESEASLRILSVGADIVSIALAILLGWKVGGRFGAFAAGWFWAYHPMTIWYAQDARPYALAALFASASALIHYRAEQRYTPLTGFLGWLVLCLGLITHYFFILVFGVLILFALINIRKSPVFFRRWAVISVAATPPLGIWLYYYRQLPTPSLPIGWIQVPKLADLPCSFWNLVSGYGGVWLISSTVFGLIAGSLLLIGIVRGGDANKYRIYLLIGVILPLCLVWVISQRRPAYIDRYFIVLLPFLLVPLSAGASKARDIFSKGKYKNPVLIPVITVFAVTGWVNAWQVHANPIHAREDWKGMVSYLHQQEAPTETPFWFLHAEMHIAFQYYFHEPYDTLESLGPPACPQTCWWVLRQPYTPPHAFTQSVTTADRPWKPSLLSSCQTLEQWDSDTGLALWKVICQ